MTVSFFCSLIGDSLKEGEPELYVKTSARLKKVERKTLLYVVRGSHCLCHESLGNLTLTEKTEN